MTDSSTGGFLAPLEAAETDDANLDDQIQPTIVGITGLDPTLVRPRWQETPPAQPARTVSWCAFGITEERAEVNPSEVHDGSADGGQGLSREYRTEEIAVLASFYGPGCRALATQLRDGLAIAQNREAMRALGLAFVSTDRITSVPELTNEQWIRRVDVAFTLRRVSWRTYAIRNILTFQGTVTAAAQSVTGPRAVGAFMKTS